MDVFRRAASEETVLEEELYDNQMGADFGLVDVMRDKGFTLHGTREVNGQPISTVYFRRRPMGYARLYFMNGRVWWNAMPDGLYVGSGNPGKAARDVSWATLSGQQFLLTNWLPELEDDQLEILRRTLRPHGLRSARPVDYFDSSRPEIWHLTNRSARPRPENRPSPPPRDIVAFFNWGYDHSTKIRLSDEDRAEARAIAETAKKYEATPAWIGLPEAKEYVAFDFWGDKIFGTFTDRLEAEVPGESCLVLAVRPVEDHPILLSTSQHVTQGIVDVIEERWDPETKTLSGISRVVGGEDYELRIYDPKTRNLRREIFRSKESDDNFSWSVRFDSGEAATP